MSPTARPATTTRLAVAYVLLELVVVPLGVLLLALSWVPMHPGREATLPDAVPSNAKAMPLAVPAASEGRAVLLVDPGQRAAR